MGFLSWLKPATARPVSVDGGRQEPSIEAPAPAADTVAGNRPVEADGAALAGFLRSEVSRAVETLRAGLHGSGDDDARRLLDDLDGEVDGVIRRPPLAAQQALSACRDPAISLGAILESFHQDPALTQALLKHANSPFYSTGGSVSSLQDAAQRVGLSGMHSVLTAAIVEGLLCRPGGEFGSMVQQIWTHLVRTAPAARRLARAARVPPETAYTLGLLHDLGKLIVFDRVTALRASGRHALVLRHDFLSTLLASVHGPLGGLAALAWNLEPDDARAIATHPRTTIRYAGERMSQVLAIAEWADLTTVRDEPRDYQGLWERAGLDLDLEACQAALEDRA